MEAKEYIIEKLNSLSEKVPNACIRYEHEEDTSSHIIEITPREIYNSNEDYISWESALYDEFVDKYPFENICFISDDALVGLNKITFEIEGVPTTNDRNTVFDAIVSINAGNSQDKMSFTFSAGGEKPQEDEMIINYIDYIYPQAA